MSPRTRSILAWSLLGLGALILLVGSLTVWVKRQALDTDAWVATSTEFLEDDEIRAAFSIYSSTSSTRTGTSKLGSSNGFRPSSTASRHLWPVRCVRLRSRPPTSSCSDRVSRTLGERQPRGARGTPANPRGRDAGGRLDGRGTVTLDLRVFIVNVGEELGFGEELDARLPEDAGQLTVLESDELSVAQDTVKVIKALTWIIIFAALAAFAGAIWLAGNGARCCERSASSSCSSGSSY